MQTFFCGNNLHISDTLIILTRATPGDKFLPFQLSSQHPFSYSDDSLGILSVSVASKHPRSDPGIGLRHDVAIAYLAEGKLRILLHDLTDRSPPPAIIVMERYGVESAVAVSLQLQSRSSSDLVPRQFVLSLLTSECKVKSYAYFANLRELAKSSSVRLLAHVLFYFVARYYSFWRCTSPCDIGSGFTVSQYSFLYGIVFRGMQRSII